MNPDPNQPVGQPQEPAPSYGPEVPQVPIVPVQPVEMPAPVVAPIPAPTPAPTVYAPAPNPFGAPPVASQPVAPIVAAQPAGNIGSSPNSNPIPNFVATSKKKKLIILISIVVGALIVLGVAAAIIIGLIFPSKSDYADAASQFDTVTTSYSDLSSSASKLSYDISSSVTDTVYTNDTDSATKSLQKFHDESTKLAAMKAIKFGDAKKFYGAYTTKSDAFVAYTNDFLTSLKSYRLIAKACSGSITSTLLTECVTALNNAGDIPNTDLKQYVTVLQTQYKSLLDISNQLATIKDAYGPQYEQYSALRKQVYAIQDTITSASSDYTSNITKHLGDIDPTSAASALADYLTKQQR